MYFVYITTNKYNAVFYVGVTNDLSRRVSEHKSHAVQGFTKKYNVDKCVFAQSFNSIKEALIAEKRIKGWTRDKKIALIKSINPDMIKITEF